MPDTLTRPTQAGVAAAEAEQAAAIAATERAALLALAAQNQPQTEERQQQSRRDAIRRILSAGRSSVSSGLDDRQRSEVDPIIEAKIAALEDIYGERFMDVLREAVESRADRLEQDEVVDSPDQQRTWAANAGRSLATRLVGESSLELAPEVEKHLGVDLHKLWMSRADTKVRGSHRKLHGSAKPLDKPFWRELGTGKELGFPGDPRAPIEQTINCRCWLWYVPADKAGEAEDTFKLPNEEFDLIAASGHAHGSILELDEAVIGAEFDVAYALVAATSSDGRTPSHGGTRERQFNEEAHKRGQGGRFARSESNQRQGQRDYEDWKNNGGWEALQQRFKNRGGKNRKGKGKGGGSGGAGGGGGGGGGGDAAAAEQDALDAQKEKIREERAVNRENLLAQRRMEDSAKFGRRLSEDMALQEVRDEISETERNVREAQRQADLIQNDIERSEDYIKQMRLHGELPEVIEAERKRLGLLQGKQKSATDTVDKLIQHSAQLGTSDVVRRLRDRVRFSRRAEDDQIKNDRASLDARIRIANQRQDEEIRQAQKALRARK